MRTCAVANAGCLRPAALGSHAGVYVTTRSDMRGRCLTCYRCGNDVCAACSSLVRVKTSVRRTNGGHAAARRVRLCDDCQEKP